jgi:hypothetical protein
MYNSKLINILKTFTKKEIKELELFINTPLFNKNIDVINLLSFFNKSHPLFNSPSITYQKISVQLFGKEDVRRIRYVMTDLTKLIEKYIAFQNYSSEEHNYLIKAYQSRGLNKYFKQEVVKQNNKINELSTIRDDYYYRSQYELNELSYQYTLENDNRNIDTELQGLVDNLDVFYLAKKLKYSCEIINRMNILKFEYDINLLNYLLDYIEKNDVKEIPSILVYYQVLKTLKEPKREENYFLLKDLIKEHLNSFQKEEQYDLYGYLQNYCIKKINTGKNDYLIKLFETYNEMLVHNVAIKDNLIAQFDFKNIVTVALRVGEFSWTENFIDEYQHYLPHDHKINAVNYNLARLYFYLKKYKACLKQLLAVEFTDIYYSLDSRALLLRTYYEMNDVESASSLINAFKIYLKRDNTISEYQNLTYSGFIKIVHQLVRFKMGYITDIKQIESQLYGIEQIADLTWLKQKIKELQ